MFLIAHQIFACKLVGVWIGTGFAIQVDYNYHVNASNSIRYRDMSHYIKFILSIFIKLYMQATL